MVANARSSVVKCKPRASEILTPQHTSKVRICFAVTCTLQFRREMDTFQFYKNV